MIRYLLDTNACIGIINDNPPALRQRVQQVEPTEIAISEIVRYELAFGVCNSKQVEKNQAALTHFLKYVQVLLNSPVLCAEQGRHPLRPPCSLS